MEFFFQSKNTIWRIWTFSIFAIYYCVKIIGATLNDSYEERSQRGMALLNNTYKTVYTEDYGSCLMACMDDPRCTSLNYGWHSSQCELNNKTKYSAEAKVFSRDLSATYMGLMREPGSLHKEHLYDPLLTLFFGYVLCYSFTIIIIIFIFFGILACAARGLTGPINPSIK